MGRQERMYPTKRKSELASRGTEDVVRGCACFVKLKSIAKAKAKAKAIQSNESANVSVPSERKRSQQTRSDQHFPGSCLLCDSLLCSALNLVQFALHCNNTTYDLLLAKKAIHIIIMINDLQRNAVLSLKTKAPFDDDLAGASFSKHLPGNIVKHAYSIRSLSPKHTMTPPWLRPCHMRTLAARSQGVTALCQGDSPQSGSAVVFHLEDDARIAMTPYLRSPSASQLVIAQLSSPTRFPRSLTVRIVCHSSE